MSRAIFPSRRGFLRSLGVGGLGAAAAGLLPSLWSRRAGASPWGDYPGSMRIGLVPAEKQAKRVLEIFLFGGISPWETFYCVDEPDFGKRDRLMWWTFQEGDETVSDLYLACQGDNAPALLQDFAKDENGVMVKLGPFTEPLRSRKDITDRLRLQVLTHTLLPHELALPLAMTGYRIGSPKLASVGAAVQHYFLTHGDQGSTEPISYVIHPVGRLQSLHLNQPAAIGQHPSFARPLMMHVGNDPTFIDALKRRSLGTLGASADRLSSYYSAELAARLTRDGVPLRSQALGDYQFALSALQNSANLLKVFDPALLEPVGADTCGEKAALGEARMQLRLAAHLLTRPGGRARHVLVIDPGVIHTLTGSGYDTHLRHVHDSALNLSYLWRELVAIINQPGEKDPAKIDLDDTLVVVNTEFGRSPGTQGAKGRNHHPYAYVTLMFGGPVGAAQRGIVGSILPDASARNALAPVETRAAILAALGIYPFTPEGYLFSDVPGAASAAEASVRLKEKVLGLTS